MYIKQKGKSSITENNNVNSKNFIFGILAFCLIIIVIINIIQLCKIVDDVNSVNEILKQYSEFSKEYIDQQELKNSYILQLVKMIFIIISEIIGVIICGNFASKVDKIKNN